MIEKLHMPFAEDAIVRIKDDFVRKRKYCKHSTDDVAERTGVTGFIIKKFEETGEITLYDFLKLAEEYGNVRAISKESFPIPVAATMEELLEMMNAEEKNSN